MRSNAYQPDIDGLRSVAVMSVLLFHVGMPGFGGGFVGVDVFFVISGFLITGLILQDLDTDTFSVKRFYLRRIRRLSPALLTTIIPTTIVAAIVLYPEQLRSFAGSLVTQFVSLQNIWFLQEGEYFVEADRKLLLHTWTLGVEEQFYLLWPLTLVLLRRFKPSRRALIIVIAMFASFGVNLALLRLSPKASFFLLPARAWELGVGGVIAMAHRRGMFKGLAGKSRAVCALLGSCFLVYAIARFSNRTTFPGWAALLPVAGAALVIVAGRGGPSPLSPVLSNKLFVHVGLISYPLYLWHWPIIALFNILGRHPSEPPNALIIILATFVLAEGTYRLIETPIRKGAWLKTNGRLLGTVGGLAALLSLLGCLSMTDGAAWRYPAAARPFLTSALNSSSDRCGFVFRVLHPKVEVCSLNHKTDGGGVLLWGNSHADMWSTALVDYGNETGRAIYLNARNCRSLADSAFCNDAVQRGVLTFLDAHYIRDVLLASTWADGDDRAFGENLAAVVELLAVRGRRVWLVVDVLTNPEFDPLVAYRENPEHPRSASVTRAQYEPAYRKQRELFDRLASRFENVHVIDPSDAFCNSTMCSAGSDDEVWFRDSNHVTIAGARHARAAFLPVFRSP